MAATKRDIVLISTADWDNPFWTNKQHVAAQLAARGHRVLYLESLGLRAATMTGRDLRRISRRLLRGLRGPRQARPNLWVISPLAVPFNRMSAIRRLNRWLIPLQTSLAARWLGFKRPLVWVYNSTAVDWLDDLAPSQVVFHWVDDLACIPGIDADMVRSADARLLERADLVFATSPSLAERAKRAKPDRAFYLPNVTDYDHFSKAREPAPLPTDLEIIPAPRIGFVGALSDYKVDFGLISALARTHPDWHFVLIGQVGEGQPHTQTPFHDLRNVHLLGPRAYGDLPDYLRGMDAAMLPMRLNDYTAAMFPMKFFEYLAAGLPVVSTPLPALTEFGECFRSAATPEAFAAALAAILDGRRPARQLCDEVARRHSWAWRLERMEECLAACAAQ